MGLLLGWAVNVAAIWVAAQLDLLSYDDRLGTLLVAAAVLGLINAVIGPIAKLLSLPFIVLTLGLFLFVVNAFLLWLAAVIVPHFDVDGFWRTLGAAVVVTLVNWALHALLRRGRDDQEQAPASAPAG